MNSGWSLRLLRAMAWGVVLLALEGPSGVAIGAPPAEKASGAKAANPLDAIRRAFDSGSYSEAEDLARSALTHAEASSGPDSLAAAEVIDLLVESLLRGGKAGDEGSLELARRALRIKEATLGPSDPSLARSLHNLGQLHSFLGDLDTARPLLERALAIREQSLGPDHQDVALSLTGLGVLHRNAGRYAEAKTLQERALRIIEKLDGPESLQCTRPLNNLAIVLSNMGDTAGARSAFERALRIREGALGPDHPLVAMSMDNLAVELLNMGDYAAARPLFERALAIRERTLGDDHPEVGTNLSNLANVLSDMGELEAGRRLYERALALQVKKLGPEHPEVVATTSNLGTVMRQMGDNTGARALFEGALRIREKLLGSEHVDIASSLTDLAETYAATGDAHKAEPLYGRAVGILTKVVGPEHPAVALNLNRTGRLLRDEGLDDQARPLFERALAIWERSLGPDHPFTVEGLVDLAGVRWRNGEPASALAAALRVESMAREHLRDSARSLSERGALRYQATRTSGLDLALSVITSGEAHGMIPQVWTELARSRGAVLDEMAARHRALAELDSPHVNELRKSLELARNRLTRLLLNVPDDEPPEDYRMRLQEAHSEKDRLERALAEASHDYGQKSAGLQFGFDQMKAALPAGWGIVAYVQYDDVPRARMSTRIDQPIRRYMAFVALPGGGASLVPLGRADRIDALVTRWRREVTVPPADAAAAESALRVGEDLRREVWDPVAAKVRGAEQLFIVPDGSLNLINFAALPDRGGRYLIETGPVIHYLSAERDLGQPAWQGPAGRGMLVIGGPDFDSSPAVSFAPAASAASREGREAAVYRGPRSSCGTFRSLNFQPLPSALAEADEVERLWVGRGRALADNGGEVLKLTGSQAAEAAFKKGAPGRRMLHVATHGFFIDEECAPSAEAAGPSPGGAAGGGAPSLLAENPLLMSGLALAGANRRDEARGADGDDGILTAEEIASLDLRSLEWVVLSSCGGGIGPIHAGEGVLGLRRTFQVAGARTLIMSLWAVEDHAARRWIRSLYEARLAGLSTPESVRRASLAMIEAGRRSGSAVHPFSWGAFVATGDWR